MFCTVTETLAPLLSYASTMLFYGAKKYQRNSLLCCGSVRSTSLSVTEEPSFYMFTGSVFCSAKPFALDLSVESNFAGVIMPGYFTLPELLKGHLDSRQFLQEKLGRVVCFPVTFQRMH